ncbi:MAG: alanine racemase [Alphaproteobacteria bacterium]|jgi:D-serine dehydratase|nr:alanine racemase [Alphaproteobacteria bacterium]
MTRTHPTEAPVDLREKGVPGGAGPVALAETGGRGWNVLREDLPLPVAVISRSALRHNSAWMRDFLARSGASIAPHGKTTMAPGLFDLQLDDGAWAITVGTPHQIQVARSFGYSRLVLANQLVGRAAIDFVMGELAGDDTFEFYCLVDSVANVAALAKAARAHGLARPFTVLVEMGFAGGRTGCRSVAQALDVARAVKAEGSALALAGVEGFEGLLKEPARVQAFLDEIVALARTAAAEDLFAAGRVILSAGGSAFYDLVVKTFRDALPGRDTLLLIRSGCYITHDSIMYTQAFDALRGRDPALAAADGGLQPALTVWAYVQSRPEAEKAILCLGKRDISYDDLPVPTVWFRPGSDMAAPAPIAEGHAVTGLNDQHCHLKVPPSSPLQVGDMVAFGISHPCLTFDKWRVIHLVDDELSVVGSIRTYF